jgi:hypothetical protein
LPIGTLQEGKHGLQTGQQTNDENFWKHRMEWIIEFFHRYILKW